MDDRETEFPFREIFTETLQFVVSDIREIHIVIPDLEKETKIVRELCPVSAIRTEALHETDGQTEESTCLVHHHPTVVGFARTDETLPPKDVQSLATVEIQHFLDEDLDRVRIPEPSTLIHGLEINIVGTVDRLRLAVDEMSTGATTANF